MACSRHFLFVLHGHLILNILLGLRLTWNLFLFPPHWEIFPLYLNLRKRGPYSWFHTILCTSRQLLMTLLSLLIQFSLPRNILIFLLLKGDKTLIIIIPRSCFSSSFLFTLLFLLCFLPCPPNHWAFFPYYCHFLITHPLLNLWIWL